jgi:Zn2+/Cd2+-exporting ATPase
MKNQAHSPYTFDEFFASGKDESVSPFLTKSSRKWSRNLSLKVSAVSAFFLLFSFIFQFFSLDLSYSFLIFVYALSGTPALINAIKDLKNFELNIDVLMTLAALLSVLIGSGLEGGLLLVLFELSGSMEHSVTQKTKSILAQLHNLSPTKASVIGEDGHLFERSIKEIAIGTKILLKAGEIAPLDSIVIEGSSFVTLGHLTGESAPITKTTGDKIPAGAKNLDGSLTLKVTRRNEESTLSKIIELITHAQESKPRLQKWLDHFDKKYATAIILLTFLFGATIPLVFKDIPFLGVEGSIYRALTFLIAASPCALIIGAPTAYLSAITSCAKKGILLKGGAILDSLASCKGIAFDKTGTLTTGDLECVSIEPLNKEAKDLSIEEAASIAGALERHVKHPIADAILRLVKKMNLPFASISSLKSIPGSGLQATLTGDTCYLGSEEFILSKAGKATWQAKESHKSSTQTYLLAGKALFLFHFQDEPRKESKALLHRLTNDLKMHVSMLTGDEEKNAHAMAKELGMTNVFSHLKPEDKLRKVEELSEKDGLIMIGDGVNDAPALARATVGISMGKIGSGTAVAASDVVFLQDDIASLDWLIKKSHKTMRIIKENLSLALFVILLATTPALLGFIPLWLAVILHEGGTLLVGLNSLRLLKK